MMNDTYVTVLGNVVEDPRYLATASGAHLASVRLASTSRRFDKEEGRWRDGDTLFLNVACWRSLGDNVAASVKKGDPLVVSGRLRMRSYTNKEGVRRVTPEIDASAVGHNLSRGIAHFQKPQRLRALEPDTNGQTADDPWATSEPVSDSENAPAGVTPDSDPESPTPNAYRPDGTHLRSAGDPTRSPDQNPSDPSGDLDHEPRQLSRNVDWTPRLAGDSSPDEQPAA